MNKNLAVHKKINQIFDSQSPEMDRLAEGFHYILEQHLEDTDREMELLKAVGDKNQLVKEQIKHSTMLHVISIFDDCYYRAKGELWQPNQTGLLEDNDE
ncbi:MAG: hypothetical protein GWN14_08320 [candidate division Zixibacteria bacterium]|nr:hypothetical protein [Gammaproteobacteria bacterium]NIX55916.1 hypothetical protein [candidate division Zixibacteria bacterium]